MSYNNASPDSWSLDGAGTLNLGSQGIATTNRNSGPNLATLTVRPTLNLTAAQTWDLRARAAVAVNGPVTGSGAVSYLSGSTTDDMLKLAGTNTFSGGFALQGGRVAITTSSAVDGSNKQVSGPFGTGVLELNGGQVVPGVSSIALRNSVLIGGNVQFGRSGATSSTLSFGGSSGSSAQLTSSVANVERRLTVQTNTTTVSFDVGIGETGAAGLGLIKDGASTLALNATNTYSGRTVIGAGTLRLGTNGAIASSREIVVSNGATFAVASVAGGYRVVAGQTLSGAGTVTGAVTVAGVLSPGLSAGDLTLRGNLAMQPGATNVIEFTDGGLTLGSFDRVLTDAGRSVTFGGVLDLRFSGGAYANATTSQVYQFSVYAGDFSQVVFSGLGVGQSAGFEPGTGSVYVIPEPGALLPVGLLALAAARRRPRD